MAVGSEANPGTRGFTPLGIIAAFVALSETAAAFAATATSGIVQMLFAVFAITFPMLVAGAFFAVLWTRAYVFYPPRDFGDSIDVKQYVDAMRHQAIGNREVVAIVQEAVGKALASSTARAALSEVARSPLHASEEMLTRASEKLVERAVEELQGAWINVDISAFGSDMPSPGLVFAFNADENAYSFLSAIYFQISDHVPPFTYGKRWALQDCESGELLLPSGVDWSNRVALADSDMTISQFGIAKGATLRVVELSKKKQSERARRDAQAKDSTSGRPLRRRSRG